jgi:hypothetical protein
MRVQALQAVKKPSKWLHPLIQGVAVLSSNGLNDLDD